MRYSSDWLLSLRHLRLQENLGYQAIAMEAKALIVSTSAASSASNRSRIDSRLSSWRNERRSCRRRIIATWSNLAHAAYTRMFVQPNKLRIGICFNVLLMNIPNKRKCFGLYFLLFVEYLSAKHWDRRQHVIYLAEQTCGYILRGLGWPYSALWKECTMNERHIIINKE